MKNQQLARNALQKARARQTKTREKRRKEGPPIIPEKLNSLSDPNPMYTRLDETTNLLGHG